MAFILGLVYIHGGGRVHKNLDRLLFNSSWLSSFLNGSLELLSKATSDHCPSLLKVLLHSHVVPKPFKFETLWTGRKSFQEVVQTSWLAPISSYGMRKFSLNLKRLKGALRAWNRPHFDYVHANVKNAEAALQAQ